VASGTHLYATRTHPFTKSSTPLYQILTHALADKSNKPKFKWLFSNLTEKDILLREGLMPFRRKCLKALDIVYLVDKPDGNWTGKYVYVSLV